MLVVLAVVSVGWRIMNSDAASRQAREYYEWSPLALQGYELYKQRGCNSCHRVLRMGEAGVAPVLDGEGTRRTEEWIHAYFLNPQAVVPGSAHTGRLGPDFRLLSTGERELFVQFLYSLKAKPGSSNYPVPPDMLKEK